MDTTSSDRSSRRRRWLDLSLALLVAVFALAPHCGPPPAPARADGARGAGAPPACGATGVCVPPWRRSWAPGVEAPRVGRGADARGEDERRRRAQDAFPPAGGL